MRIARLVLKLIVLPLILLAVVVRFAFPSSAWWIDYTFMALCLLALVLAAIGRLLGEKSSDTHPPSVD